MRFLRLALDICLDFVHAGVAYWVYSALFGWLFGPAAGPVLHIGLHVWMLLTSPDDEPLSLREQCIASAVAVGLSGGELWAWWRGGPPGRTLPPAAI